MSIARVEPLIGIAEPIGIVGIGDVVVGNQAGQFGGRHDTRGRGAIIDLPRHGIAAIIALVIFARMARKWSDMNA